MIRTATDTLYRAPDATRRPRGIARTLAATGVLACAVLAVFAVAASPLPQGLAPLGIPTLPALRFVQRTDVGETAAAEAARRATGGKVLSVSRDDDDRDATYRVKVLLESGKVRVVQVDASSGKVR